MGILCQCTSIISLVSLDWECDRYSMVAHSVRTAAKARNFDEMVVGLMHEVYGGSFYARTLFSCDVSEDSLESALKLFVPPQRKIYVRIDEEVNDSDLLACNRPQEFNEDELADWMMAETKWSDRYRRWLNRFKKNEIARNVMIYDLEDKLSVLLNPGEYEDKYGPQYYVLPWKKHFNVSVGRCGYSVPGNDDELLLRPLTENERSNLIEKYSRGLLFLRESLVEGSNPDDYTPEEQQRNRDRLTNWLNEWIANEKILEAEYYREEE